MKNHKMDRLFRQSAKGELVFYMVNWLKGDKIVASAPFDHLLDAKAHAKDRLYINRVRRGITGAEVADVDGVIYFRAGEAR